MKLFKDYAVLASGQVASKILIFVAFAFLARALDPEGYGAVEYLTGLGVLFTTIVDGGLGVIGVRRVAQRPDELATVAFQIRVARLVLTLIAVPIMFGFALFATNSALSVGLVFLFAASVLTVPWRQEWLFQATERMTEAAIAQLVRAGLFAALVFALVRGPEQLIVVGWTELLSAIAMTAYCVHYQHTHITAVRMIGSLEGISALAREGVALGATNFVWAASQYAPLFLIAVLVGGSETAWFAGAARLVGSLSIFSYLYHYSLYPAVARATARRDGKLGRLLAESYRVTAWTAILIALAVTVLAEPIVAIALGVKLAPAAPILKIAAWMFPLELCSGHARWALVAAGAQTRLLRAQVAGLATTAAVALLVGPWIGATGFAFAALAGLVSIWIVAHAFADRLGATPPRATLAWKPAFCAAALVFANDALALTPWQSIAGLAAFVAAAPIVDRRLLADIRNLGNAKLGFRAAGPDA